MAGTEWSIWCGTKRSKKQHLSRSGVATLGSTTLFACGRRAAVAFALVTNDPKCVQCVAFERWHKREVGR